MLLTAWEMHLFNQKASDLTGWQKKRCWALRFMKSFIDAEKTGPSILRRCEMLGVLHKKVLCE